MGGLVATFLALHLCEETHLYGFYLSEHSPDLGDVPYSYYQPTSNGKRTWEEPSITQYHDFELDSFMLGRLMEHELVSVHI
jgi:hypothetical protein